MTKPPKMGTDCRTRQLASLRDPLPFIIGGLMHDFRNRFAIVTASHDLISVSLKKGAIKEVWELLEMMEHAFDDITSIIGFIHATCRPFYDDATSVTNKTSPLELITYLRSNCTIKSDAFAWRIVGLRGIPVLSFPPMGLGFIFKQLVENAEKASRLVHHKVLLVIRVSYNRKEQMLQIRATDNGPGFKEDELNKQNDRQNRENQRYSGLRIILEMAMRMYGWGSLSNRRKGGAIVDLALQIKPSDDQ